MIEMYINFIVIKLWLSRFIKNEFLEIYSGLLDVRSL